MRPAYWCIVEAITQYCSECVLPFFQHSLNIIGQIHHSVFSEIIWQRYVVLFQSRTFRIGGYVRYHYILTYFLAIKVEFKKAKTSNISTCRGHIFTYGERFSKQWSWRRRMFWDSSFLRSSVRRLW